MAGRTSFTVYEGMTGMSKNVFINMKDRSFTITVDVEVPKSSAGTLLVNGKQTAQGAERTQFVASEPVPLPLRRFVKGVPTVGTIRQFSLHYQSAYFGGRGCLPTAMQRLSGSS
ncbi:MAG: hypothetical protein AB2L11_13565 [Syntrophobacteraceae bacterium]